MRADKFFAERFGSRTKAAEFLSKGLVLRRGKALKPSDEIQDGDEFVFLNADEIFVSNGGYKLSRALKEFHVDISGGIFADIGASTGGFTDCLLQNGAKHVYCIDVGESQLDPKIASDSRVTVMDRTNARYLTRESFPEPIDAVVSDVSFISLKLIFPAISSILRDGGKGLVLVKPQFESENKNIGKSGIVAKKYHPAILSSIWNSAVANSLAPIAIVNAPIREKKNIEYVLLLVKNAVPVSKSDILQSAENLFEDRS